MSLETLIAGRFELEEEVHVGRMSKLYRARDLENGARTALKVPLSEHESIYQRFAIEAEIVAGFSHPAIVRHVANGGQASSLYLAIEWLDGEHLMARLERGPLPVEDCLALGIRAAQALGEVHRAGVVHRDVKPSNLFLRGAMPADVVLIDFGISRRGQSGQGLSKHASFAGGTWAYMSPEQTMGAAELGARADVFGLGCVLFECATGRPAYPHDRSGATVAKVWNDPPRARAERPDMPAKLDNLIWRLMSRDPAARPSNGDVVATELATITP